LPRTIYGMVLEYWPRKYADVDDLALIRMNAQAADAIECTLSSLIHHTDEQQHRFCHLSSIQPTALAQDHRMYFMADGLIRSIPLLPIDFRHNFFDAATAVSPISPSAPNTLCRNLNIYTPSLIRNPAALPQPLPALRVCIAIPFC
jgi:anaerobic glycerol-3-phosphate dehydrogenase